MAVINPVIPMPGALFTFGFNDTVPRTTTSRSGYPTLVLPYGITQVADYEFCPYFSGSNRYGIFPYCRGVLIPDSVTSIGNYAFYGWSSATSLVIPDSVTSIGTNAFDGWSSCNDIYSHRQTPATITANTFSNLKTGCRIHVPAGSAAAYRAAANWPKEPAVTYIEDL